MPRMITYGGEMIRIGERNRIEYSKNGSSSWSSRCTSTSSYGEFLSFVEGKELLAATSKGLYCSKNSGSSWSKR